MQTLQDSLASASSKSWIDALIEKRKVIATLTALLVVAGAVYAVYSSYRDKQNAKAAGEIFMATEKLHKTESPTTPAVPPTVAELKELEAVALAHKGTAASADALMKIGDIAFDTGDYVKAAASYDAVVSSAPNRTFKSYALYALGVAQENNKEYKKAAESFYTALRLGEAPLKLELLLGLARNYALAGEKTKAVDQYNAVTTEFPNTPSAKFAERQKAVLK